MPETYHRYHYPSQPYYVRLNRHPGDQPDNNYSHTAGRDRCAAAARYREKAKMREHRRATLATQLPATGTEQATMAKPTLCMPEAIWPEAPNWAGRLPTDMAAPQPLSPIGRGLASDPNRVARRHAWTDLALEQTPRHRPAGPSAVSALQLYTDGTGGTTTPVGTQSPPAWAFMIHRAYQNDRRHVPFRRNGNRDNRLRRHRK